MDTSSGYCSQIPAPSKKVNLLRDELFGRQKREILAADQRFNPGDWNINLAANRRGKRARGAFNLGGDLHLERNLDFEGASQK